MQFVGGSLLSRFAPRRGLATLRQSIVRHCHGDNRPSRRGNERLFSAEFSKRLGVHPDGAGRTYPLGDRAPQKRRVPVAPLLKRVGLTPEQIAEPEERLSVRSQIALLNEAAIALKDDFLGFSLARDFDPREIGLLYYVMASSQTLGDALKRIARYSRITNEAVVFGYQEGNRLLIDLSYSGVTRHSDLHQIEFCLFGALRICRVLTGEKLVPQHFSISHHRSDNTSEMARFVGTKVEFGAEADEFALNVHARELPLIQSDSYLNGLLLKYCEAALAERRADTSQLRTRVENAISSVLPHGKVLVEDIVRAIWE
jgi:Arabinose-binding domain of AraC transcription regulator, N-term